MTSSLRVGAELKPQFYKNNRTLIKAFSAQKGDIPLERLSIDLKGPLTTEGFINRYILGVDECSRFPFTYPCSDLTSDTVIVKLNDVLLRVVGTYR